MEIGGKMFDDKNHVYMIGVLNITPDSFFDGGRFNSKKLALMQAEKLISEGADLIDVGAESTRPNSLPITCEEEISRLGDVVVELKKQFNVPVSVDTTKAKVAEIVLNQGADLINDISGLSDARMAGVVAAFNSVYCLTSNFQLPVGENFLKIMKLEFEKKISMLEEQGVARNKIILDPGIGFNKTCEQNLLVLKYISEIKSWGFPLLVGASNKSFIGKVLNQPDVNLRQAGTLAVSAMLAFCNVNFIRVHDVKSNLEAVKIVSAIRSA